MATAQALRVQSNLLHPQFQSGIELINREFEVLRYYFCYVYRGNDSLFAKRTNESSRLSRQNLLTQLIRSCEILANQSHHFDIDRTHEILELKKQAETELSNYRAQEKRQAFFLVKK